MSEFICLRKYYYYHQSAILSVNLVLGHLSLIAQFAKIICKNQNVETVNALKGFYSMRQEKYALSNI